MIIYRVRVNLATTLHCGYQYGVACAIYDDLEPSARGHVSLERYDGSWLGSFFGPWATLHAKSVSSDL